MGASLFACRSLLRWTPGLDQAGHHTIVVGFPAQGINVTIDFHIADAFDNPDNKGIEDRERYLYEYGVPVMHVAVPTESFPDSRDFVPAEIIYKGHMYPGDTLVKGRGATSSNFPQRSYQLRFDEEQLFSDAQLGGGVALRHVALLTTFDDPSFVRQHVAYGVWRNMSDAHIAVTPPMHAVLYLNGNYMGLYLLSERVDGEFSRRHNLNPKGNM